MNKENGDATKTIVESVRKVLAELFKDGLPVINLDEGESNGSDAIVDHTAQPPTTSEPVSEAESPEDWVLDALAVIDHEGESSSSSATADYAAQPTAQSPTTSAEPVFEAESAGGWDFDALHWQMNSESNISGGIVDYTAPPPTTATWEPVSEPDIVEWDLDGTLRAINKPNVSGVMAEHAAQQPTTSEPEPEILQEWEFDSCTFQVCKSDFPTEILDPTWVRDHSYTSSHRTNTPPLTATLEPVLESDSVELGFDNGFSF
jgi:hypothetical protein